MLRAFVGFSLLALFTLPVVAQDKKKTDVDVDKPAVKKKTDVDVDKPAVKKKTDVDVDKDTAKAVTDTKKKAFTTGKIAGKVVQVEGSSKNFTVEVTTKIQKPNVQAAQTMARLQAQIADASRRRDFNQVASLQRQMAQQQPYTFEDHRIKFELQAADDLKVRTFRLPVEYDDKGKPRQYTQKELKELKGSDLKLPGYTADWENLRAGQQVEVTVLRPKTTAPKAKPKDKDRDFIVEDERPKATLIVIYADPPPK